MTSLAFNISRTTLHALLCICFAAVSEAAAQTGRPAVDVVAGGTVGHGGDYSDRSAFMVGLGLSAPSQMRLLGRLSLAVDVTGKPRGDLCRPAQLGGCIPHFPDLRAVTVEGRFARQAIAFVRLESFVLAGGASYDFKSAAQANFSALVSGGGVRAVIAASNRAASLASCRAFAVLTTSRGRLWTGLCSLGLRVRT